MTSMTSRRRSKTGTDESLKSLDLELTDDVVSTVDFDSNELLDGGDECVRCHLVIHRNEFVRCTATGQWQHEVCPVRRLRERSRQKLLAGSVR